jgi:two-component system sensor histidine kinase ChvG
MRILPKIASSIAAKLAVILVVFVACPLMIYFEFRNADEEKNALLLRNVQEQGRLIARALEPMLVSAEPDVLPKVNQELERLSQNQIKVRLLFRPQAAEPDNFFYVASVPPVAASYLQQERGELIKTGILERLRDSCAGDRSVELRYTNPAGQEEVLSSVTLVNAAVGCWAVVTSHTKADFLLSSLAQPYWKTPEVQLAAGIYVLMAVLVLSLIVGIWSNLLRFGRYARAITQDRLHGASFVRLNRVPELDSVAEEFDHLVGTLQGSATAIRNAAEENAHAFKTPIAVIAQSLEPLKRAVPADNSRGQRALLLVERSIEKLDALISAARRMDEAIAELINPPRGDVDLSDLVTQLMAGYEGNSRSLGLRLVARIAPGIHVMGAIDLIETALENVVDNALSFSPPESIVAVNLIREDHHAVLVVADSGPGVDSRHIDKIFERYFSHRPLRRAHDEAVEGDSHFGIGLWVVRRNIEALEGTVTAINRPQGGLAVTIRLPLAR